MTHVLPSLIAGLIFLTVLLPNPVIGATLAPVSNVLAATATHIVAPGDTLYSIARRYGTTVDTLKATNGLTSNVIWIGQTLHVGASSPQPPTGTYHTVVRGDTLYSLARRYGTTVDAIMQANWLTSPYIYVGQRLIISSASVPPTGSTTYTVVHGDTLYSIARRYGTTVEAIKATNGLPSTHIYVGQQLLIPSTQTPIAPTSVAPTAVVPTAVSTATPTGTATQVVAPTLTSSPSSTILPTQAPATTVPTRTPSATPMPTTTPISSPPPNVDRCLVEVVQQGRSEPEYVGLNGFLKGSPSGDTYADLPPYPWVVPILVQTGPDLWEEGDQTLPAKTPVVVLEQHLNHEGFGRYTGRLVVRSLADSAQYNVDHYDFVPTEYWTCPPHLAIRYSPFIARVKDGVTPVDTDGRFQEMGELREVYCTRSPFIAEERYVEDGVVCLMYKEYRNGYGGVPHIFPSGGLEIVY